jgi:hypothetical protein
MVPEMQDFVDSLCQCFGTNIPPPEKYHSRSQSNSRQPNGSTGTLSAEGKVRSHGSILPESQMEAALKYTSKRVSCCSGVGVDNRCGVSGAVMTSEQAVVLAKTKQAASRSTRKLQKNNSQNPASNSNSHGNTYVAPTSRSHSSSTSHKRRRSTGSRDDIFRSKSRTDSGISSNNSGSGSAQANPFSRFLSNHPVLMNSLCFATPIKGDSSDDNGAGGAPVDGQSVISACDDEDEEDDNNTMTSTVFYETTKLAGLRQTNPPMPLFNHFSVEETDDIHKIVASHSHSSAKLVDMFRSFHNSLHQQQQQRRRSANTERTDVDGDDHYMMDVSTTTTNKVVLDHTRVRHQRQLEYDNIPPPMTKCSSDSKSSKSSNGTNTAT